MNHYLKNLKHGAEELAQSAKGLLHRHEAWSLVSRTHGKRLDTVGLACNPELGRWRQGSLVFRRAGTMRLRPIRDSISRNRVDWQDSSARREILAIYSQ